MKAHSVAWLFLWCPSVSLQHIGHTYTPTPSPWMTHSHRVRKVTSCSHCAHQRRERVPVDRRSQQGSPSKALPHGEKDVWLRQTERSGRGKSEKLRRGTWGKWECRREGEREGKRLMLPANLRQEYGQENVLSTLTQVPIKSPFLPA